jgi:hypothetical protein
MNRVIRAGAFIGAVFATLAIGGAAAKAVSLLGSDQFGDLFSIDTSTGASTLIGVGPPSTEIEFDQSTGILYSEGSDGDTSLSTVNPATGASTGFVTHPYGALNGLEFVGSTLYGTFIPISNAPSPLMIVDLLTGNFTPVGATGLGPISGLAYDATAGTMYGVTAGSGLANLVTVDLLAGTAAVVAPILDGAGNQLDKVGSIEFGSDGVLYGGLSQNAAFNAGYLFSIDTATGGASFIGDTGFSITGLTNTQPIPEPIAPLLFGAGVLVVGRALRRRSA